MTHVDRKLDHMTQMLQQVVELQRFQLQQSQSTTLQNRIAHDTEETNQNQSQQT